MPEYLLGAQRFERFSSWKSMVWAISRLIKRVRSEVKVPDSEGRRGEGSAQANSCDHQGRHFTEGALRSAGLWLIGGKKLVSTVIPKCVTCKRLRGKLEEQKMSELPADRLSSSPSFTRVGVDNFGPWTVTSQRTRGGHAESKQWAAIFTCLSTKAVHIEVLKAMTTASFINGLRRFTAIRGPIKTLRLDRGTNFIGACK